MSHLIFVSSDDLHPLSITLAVRDAYHQSGWSSGSCISKDKPRRKYSDVVKSKKVFGDKAQIVEKTAKSHLQQKKPSGTSLSIQNLWINKKGESVKNNAVDVVMDVRLAPLMHRSGGSMGTAGTAYWRPWD